MTVQLSPIPIHVIFFVQNLEDWMLSERQFVVSRGIEIVFCYCFHFYLGFSNAFGLLGMIKCFTNCLYYKIFFLYECTTLVNVYLQSLSRKSIEHWTINTVLTSHYLHFYVRSSKHKIFLSSKHQFPQLLRIHSVKSEIKKIFN